jgi:hypothetical protein
MASRREILMGVIAINIDLPPFGELETSGDGSSPTDAQMSEEMQARQNFLDTASPYFESLVKRPPHRFGNVSRVELLGQATWSNLNHYHLHLTVDLGLPPGIEQELLAMLPKGSQVSVGGDFEFLRAWPA